MLYHEHGGLEVLRYEEVRDPEPGPVDVVVDVAATALNRLDVVQRNGWFTMPGFRFHIAGMDVAGVVSVIGDDVIDVAVGDRVVVDPSLSGVDDRSKLAGMGDLFGELGIIGATVDGGYAERCLVPASHVYHVPDGLPLEHAAPFATCFVTASHALFDIGKLVSGETVMIHAAGSGLSTAAIQLAKHAGATVLATAGTDAKCERALTLGADHVLNNRTGDVTRWARGVTAGAGVDMVLDHIGTATVRRHGHRRSPARASGARWHVALRGVGSVAEMGFHLARQVLAGAGAFALLKGQVLAFVFVAFVSFSALAAPSSSSAHSSLSAPRTSAPGDGSLPETPSSVSEPASTHPASTRSPPPAPAQRAPGSLPASTTPHARSAKPPASPSLARSLHSPTQPSGCASGSRSVDSSARSSSRSHSHTCRGPRPATKPTPPTS